MDRRMARRRSRTWRARARLLCEIVLVSSIAALAVADEHGWPRHDAGFASVAVAPRWTLNEVAQGVRIDSPNGPFEASVWLRLHPNDDLDAHRAPGHTTSWIGGVGWTEDTREGEGMRETTRVALRSGGLVQVVTSVALDREDVHGRDIDAMVASIRLAP